MIREQPVQVKGKLVDDVTRCVHYHSLVDVIAIKFKCCREYYPCFQCHEEEAGHKAQTWSRDELGTKAILCGVCKNEMSINDYLQAGDHCPHCSAPFNPKCSLHHHLYFDL